MQQSYSFVITGATGFVGSQIAPLLARGGRVLLVSRDIRAPSTLFPNCEVASYDDLPKHDLRNSTFLHLAVRNNDKPGTLSQFEEVNVRFLLQVATLARNSGAAQFINICSTRALDPKSADLYGRSKKEGAYRLCQLWPGGAVNVYVPVIYGKRFAGKLSWINRMPAPAHTGILAVLRLARPLLSVERLAIVVQTMTVSNTSGTDPAEHERYVADEVPARGLYRFLKRGLDFSAGVSVLMFGWWLFGLIALWVRFDSPGPALFAQKRVGKGGRLFTCYKFRTMFLNTAETATHHSSENNITRAGRFLRRTKLDELPQAINLVRNEMSLVGPRPCLPMQEELIAERETRGILATKPGITGLAQVRGLDMSQPALLAAVEDQYKTFATFLGDISIVLRTIAGGGSGDRIRTELDAC